MAVRRVFIAAAVAAVIVAIAVREPRTPSAGSTVSVARRTTELAAAIASAEARVLAARAAAALARRDVGAAEESRDEPEPAQDWLDDYAGGIENVAPLNDDQRAQLRIVKLRHQAIFERELGEAQLDRPVLTADE